MIIMVNQSSSHILHQWEFIFQILYMLHLSDLRFEILISDDRLRYDLYARHILQSFLYLNIIDDNIAN